MPSPPCLGTETNDTNVTGGRRLQTLDPCGIASVAPELVLAEFGRVACCGFLLRSTFWGSGCWSLRGFTAFFGCLILIYMPGPPLMPMRFHEELTSFGRSHSCLLGSVLPWRAGDFPLLVFHFTVQVLCSHYLQEELQTQIDP